MLPVVTGRFLFSQAPDLLLPMWKQGQLQPGWLPAGCPDSAQRGLSGLATPGPRLISGWPELPPTSQALFYPLNTTLLGRNYYPHYTNVKTETQGGKVIVSRW